MANRAKIIETLYEYFQDKGRVLNSQEYARETDTPVRLQQIRNIFGSWNRMEKLLMARERKNNTSEPEAITDVDEVIRKRSADLIEAGKQFVAASENQDAKARREAEAQFVAEELAVNALTPQGANFNKIAIGGKLPHEQQDFAAMGATVRIDPETLDQTIVDPKPETPDAQGATDLTPIGLRNTVAEEGGVQNENVQAGDQTDGGGTGQASVATARAVEANDSGA